MDGNKVGFDNPEIEDEIIAELSRKYRNDRYFDGGLLDKMIKERVKADMEATLRSWGWTESEEEPGVWLRPGSQDITK